MAIGSLIAVCWYVLFMGTLEYYTNWAQKAAKERKRPEQITGLTGEGGNQQRRTMVITISSSPGFEPPARVLLSVGEGVEVSVEGKEKEAKG